MTKKEFKNLRINHPVIITVKGKMNKKTGIVIDIIRHGDKYSENVVWVELRDDTYLQPVCYHYRSIKFHYGYFVDKLNEIIHRTLKRKPTPPIHFTAIMKCKQNGKTFVNSESWLDSSFSLEELLVIERFTSAIETRTEGGLRIVCEPAPYST